MNVYLHLPRRLINVGITYIVMYIYECCVCIRTLRLHFVCVSFPCFLMNEYGTDGNLGRKIKVIHNLKALFSRIPSSDLSLI